MTARVLVVNNVRQPYHTVLFLQLKTNAWPKAIEYEGIAKIKDKLGIAYTFDFIHEINHSSSCLRLFIVTARATHQPNVHLSF